MNQASLALSGPEPELVDGWEVAREGGVPLVRDVDLAERAGLAQPRDIRKIIVKNRAELEEFGALSVRVRQARTAIPGGNGFRVDDILEYWLNEDQAVALVAMLRTSVARVLRVSLVKLFGALRRGEIGETARRLPANYIAALEELVVSEKEKEQALAQIEAMRANHDLGKLLASTTNTLSVEEVAKMFGMGRNTLFERMRELGIIEKKPSRMPYQEHLDAKRFDVKPFTYPTNTRGAQQCPVTRVTAKGQQYLARRLGLIGGDE